MRQAKGRKAERHKEGKAPLDPPDAKKPEVCLPTTQTYGLVWARGAAPPRTPAKGSFKKT